MRGNKTTTRDTLPRKTVTKIWWGNKKLYRQAKFKSSAPSNQLYRKVKGNSLGEKEKATTRNKKITKWKKIISIDKYTVKVCLILSHFTNIADFINWRFVEALHSVSVGFIVSTAFTHFLSLSQIKQTQHSSGLKKQTDKTEPVFVENLLCTKHSFKL